MKIITLIENRKISNSLKCNHGLSLYIESNGKKILFDTGADSKFVFNAKKLNVNLKEIDILVISHGHYDHGGGLKAFLRINKKAIIYISKNAFLKYYSTKKIPIYIGLNEKLLNDRFVFIEKDLTIFDSIILFNNVKGDILVPFGNSNLKIKNEDKTYSEDLFEHELNMILIENSSNYLFSGCSHRGVININNTAKSYIKKIDYYIGGMHLKSINKKNEKNINYLDKLIEYLQEEDISKIYTGHCTGDFAYTYLKEKYYKIDKFSTGSITCFKE